ncbi:hypothetical protein CL617_01345 [archaeon]|nr:hypothetical protein [archaeon]|tara:strand:- start:7874 stop:8662 length:789 start_codon:yes stop_codon:yes gene_type:complete
MIVKNDFLKKLRSIFDLNIYEAKIWAALLSKGVSSAGELSEISGVPRSRSYDVLESLEKRGFIIMKVGKPIKYIAVKPNEVVNRVKSSLMAKAHENIQVIEDMKDTEDFRELDLLFKQGIEHVDPANLSGALKGRSNVYNQISNMLRGAKRSVVLMTTSKGLKRKADLLKLNLKKLKDVKVKILVPIDEEIKDTVEELKEFAEIKHTEDVKSRFCVVDGEDVLFLLKNDDNVHEAYDSAIWVKTSLFGGALESFFDNAWEKL